MTEEYGLCEFCGSNRAVLANHFEKDLVTPRKINICNGCHLALHNLPLGEQCVPCKIKLPRSSLPFFQQLYSNIVDVHGNLIISGERIFNARYEIVEDEVWKPNSLAEMFDKLANGKLK